MFCPEIINFFNSKSKSMSVTTNMNTEHFYQRKSIQFFFNFFPESEWKNQLITVIDYGISQLIKNYDFKSLSNQQAKSLMNDIKANNQIALNSPERNIKTKEKEKEVSVYQNKIIPSSPPQIKNRITDNNTNASPIKKTKYDTNMNNKNLQQMKNKQDRSPEIKTNSKKISNIRNKSPLTINQNTNNDEKDNTIKDKDYKNVTSKIKKQVENDKKLHNFLSNMSYKKICKEYEYKEEEEEDTGKIPKDMSTEIEWKYEEYVKNNRETKEYKEKHLNLSNIKQEEKNRNFAIAYDKSFKPQFIKEKSKENLNSNYNDNDKAISTPYLNSKKETFEKLQNSDRNYAKFSNHKDQRTNNNSNNTSSYINNDDYRKQSPIMIYPERNRNNIKDDNFEKIHNKQNDIDVYENKYAVTNKLDSYNYHNNYNNHNKPYKNDIAHTYSNNNSNNVYGNNNTQCNYAKTIQSNMKQHNYLNDERIYNQYKKGTINNKYASDDDDDMMISQNYLSSYADTDKSN